ncbi:hypothetical protein RJ40_00960 [Methanofollis aquaemaris]|uniref:Transmembrane protein n=1 Tax=Methanofollis aquaemaris TaxID=126734 RepID=A0A8A3S0K9_9EURY|nr:hypothetical protein [Methanofollis aquaemaris]QSZ66167.1 hypothetical protein RJ40_00960 [Methanofollis aquaemaris]
MTCVSPCRLSGSMTDEQEETVSCPHCGGPLISEKFPDPALCDACLSEIEQTTRSLLFTRTITGDLAIEAVRAWWGGILMTWNLRDRAQVTDCQLKYFPFWKLTAHLTGFVKGYKTESEVNVPVEESVDDDFVWTEIACDASDLGIYYLRNLDGETGPYDVGAFTGRVPEVIVPRTDAVSEGIAGLEYGVLMHSEIPTITEHELHFSDCENTLLIYPFWIVRYAYAGRTYFATVDGVTGDIIAGRAPGSLFWRICAFVAATTVTFLAVPVWIYLMEVVFPGSAGYFSEIFGDIVWFAVILAVLMAAGWGIVLDVFALSWYGAEISSGDLHGGYRFRYTSEHAPSRNARAIGGILPGFGMMVVGGFVFFNEGRWPGLVAAAAGLVVYIVSGVSLYNPAWEKVGRHWARDTWPVEKG